MHKSWGKALFTLSVFIFLFFSCASTSKIPEGKADEEDVVSFTVQRKETRSYFSSVNPKIMELVETGSPVALRQAVSLLHKSVSDDYTEPEKVLMFCCTKIMSIVWPSETLNWEAPVLTAENSYSGAIESARRGIYDSSTGNTDFLTIVLPSLVLLTSTSRTDFYSDSEAALKSALSLRSDSVLVNYLLGILELKKKNIDLAFQYFKNAEKNAVDNFEIQLSLTQCCFEKHDYMQCLDRSELLLAKYPQNVKLLEYAARSSYAMNDLSKSENYIVRLLLVEPENLEYVLLRAKILMDKSDYIRASSLLDVYSRTDSSAKEYLILRSKLQRDWNKNASGAAETIGKALIYYPEDLEVLMLASEISSGFNIVVNGMNARELSEKILLQEPENLQAMEICISEMIKKGEWQGAYEMSSKVISITEKSSALYNHVEICIALNKNTEALNIAEKMYEADKADENAQQSYIKVLVSTNQRSNASLLIASLLQGANARMKSFLYYEKSLMAASEDEALNDLRSSLTANPRNKDSLYRLYEIYYKKTDWRRAQYYLKQVVALDPSDTAVLRKNAELDSLLGK